MSLFRSIRVRASQGTQYITDLRKAVPTGFHGLPTIAPTPCSVGCTACRDACPTKAIALEPLTLDVGRCVFCNECVESCPEGKLALTSEPRMGATRREDLLVREGAGITPVVASEAFSRIFGRSLKMRQVSAGGCSACELELGALANVNFDLQRFGIEWVASPRHADALVLTGPLTRTMRDAVSLAWEAMPEPRFVVAFGACAISGGLYESGSGVDRELLDTLGPSLWVPGCPPHPLAFVDAILRFLGVHPTG